MAERNLSLLSIHNDKELSLSWGVSKQYVNQLRQRYKNHGIYKRPTREDKIVKYLKENDGKIPSVRKLCVILQISTAKITINRILKLAEKHNIKCEFLKQEVFEHCYYSYLKKNCRCDICKLSKNLAGYTYLHFGKVHAVFTNRYANEYIDSYLKDQTCYKKIFFDKFKKDYAKFLENQPSRPNRKPKNKTRHSSLMVVNGFSCYD